MSVSLLVGSAFPNSLSSNTNLLLAEIQPTRHNQFFEEHAVQLSVDIGLERPINIKPMAVIISGSKWGGQCLSYVQKIKNYTTLEFSGYPNRIIPNTSEAQIGYAVLTTEGRVGHIAIIRDIQRDELILLESNFYGDEMITDNRKLNINSEVIRGYYKF